MSLSLLYWPPTSCRYSEKTYGQSLTYSKSDRLVDWLTGKGYYHGFHPVNLGSKMYKGLNNKQRGKSRIWNRHIFPTINWKKTNSEMDPKYTFITNKDYSSKNSLIGTYFLIDLLISRSKNLKTLFRKSSHGVLLSWW